MLKSASGVTGFVFTLLGLGFSVPGVILLRLWRTTDEPTHSYPCTSSTGGTATCYSGEGVYGLLGGIFGALGVAMLLLGLWLLRKAWRDAARRRRLLADGRRVHGTVLAAAPSGMTVNGVRWWNHEVSFPGPGGTVQMRHRGPRAAEAGAHVEVAYDPAEPANAMLVGAVWPEVAATGPPDDATPIPGLEAPVVRAAGTLGFDLDAVHDAQQRYLRGEITSDQLQAETKRLMSPPA